MGVVAHQVDDGAAHAAEVENPATHQQEAPVSCIMACVTAATADPPCLYQPWFSTAAQKQFGQGL